MTLNPFRLFKRWQRLRREVEQEVFYLRRQHGERAYEAALAEMERPELTSWGRQVMEEAARRLKPDHAAGDRSRPKGRTAA